MKIPFDELSYIQDAIYVLFVTANFIFMIFFIYKLKDSEYWSFIPPIIISCVFIAPRPHYLFMLMPFLLTENKKQHD